MKILFIILIIILFSSCAVINSLLGLNNECCYPDCERTRINNCSYCIVHCDTYNVPEDFDSKLRKSIDKQVRQHRDNLKLLDKKIYHPRDRYK